jgi:hypothetical protein
LKKAFLQLEKYLEHLPEEDIPEIMLVCDFENIHLYRPSSGQKRKFNTKNLYKYIKCFISIAGYESERINDDFVDVNVRAAEKMAWLHDNLKKYGYDGHELEVYLVRLLICFFAEHTGMFPIRYLYKYLERSKPDGSDLSFLIEKLFSILNMPDEERNKCAFLTEELKAFMYIDSTLFKETLRLADFDSKMRKILLDCTSFDWSKISPAIFGAMFQGVMDKKERRELGAHYTSEENILKLINPLFMGELWNEFEKIKTSPKKLIEFHKKISKLKFLDPACGCGNFLIITYRELRRLELEIFKIQNSSHSKILDIKLSLKVGIEQFFGIEIEEFPSQIAQVGMWLTDHQMNMLVSEEFGYYYVRPPLAESATIVCGNALRLDWKNIIPNHELSYILGNPPFSGSKMLTQTGREDISHVFKDEFGNIVKGFGRLDYVAAWYFKAAQYIQGTNIHVAFVSTNSITQGEQVASFWKPLFHEFSIHIDFAWRTFKWTSVAKGKAAVYCVIVGFSLENSRKERIIYDDAIKITSKNINPYLVDAPNVFLESRQKPLCDIPELGIGNKPIDNGNFLFTDAEKEVFVGIEPLSQKWFKRYVGAYEFINGSYRWCLWLGNCPPDELRKMPEVLKRIEAVRQFRLSSKSEPTIKLAEKPVHFHIENMPTAKYLVIPRVTSEKRNYIPIGFLFPKIITSDSMLILPNATYFHFGILTSSVHMAWVRAVCGRLKSDYRYSKEIVYNNFPWPDISIKQKAEIETCAKCIIDVRKHFYNSTLADLYDPLTMPRELLKAHQTLDRVVLNAYKFSLKEPSESSIVAKLFERYQLLTS